MKKKSRNMAGKRTTRRSRTGEKQEFTPRGVKNPHIPWVQIREPFSPDTTLEDAVGLNYLNRKVDPIKEKRKGSENAD